MQAIWIALQVALQMAMHVWVKADAMVVVCLLNSEKFGPAEVRHVVAQIHEFTRGRHIRFSHIHREGNRAADFLANKGLHAQEMERFDQVTAPRRLRAFVQLDQLGLPNFRFRYVYS